MDSTFKPKLKTRRRRIVDPGARKKAFFSCDRCKTRKLACKRPVNTPDTTEPCMKCVAAGVKCETTIQRKKKERGPIENIGLHYKCLYALVKGLRPDIDPNDIDSLVFLGESLGIPMPSRFGANSDQEKEDILDISIKLTSKTKGGYLSTAEETFERVLNAHDQRIVPFHSFTQPDSIIIDQVGTFHYIGPFGAAGFLDTCVNILVRQSKLNSNILQNYHELFQCEIIISSNQDPLTFADVSSLREETFPYINALSKNEMDYYFNVFFKSVHPRYYCFNETKIRNNYDTFWMLLVLETSKNTMLSNYQICCIYMIVVLGAVFNGTRPNDDVVQKYVNVVRFCVSDMVLSPSLEGIQCLFLLSIYMDNNKRRDTGYCLIETATRQAITLGMNKKSVSICIDDKELIEEMKFTWWTIFKQELVFSNQMGRSSCIQIEDIDVEYPQIQDIDLKAYFYGTCDLSRILYELLEYRKIVKTELLFPDNIKLTKELLKKFREWYNELPANLKNTDSINDYKLDLLMRYHYYILSLTLPYLEYLSLEDKIYDVSVNEIIKENLESSIVMARLLELSVQKGLFNGTIFQYLFFIYHSSMSLVVGYILLNKNPHLFWKTVNVYEVSGAISLIRRINVDNFRKITGSSKKISKFIHILFNGLNILEFLAGEYGDNLENKDEQFFRINLPIIHTSNVSNVALSKELNILPSIFKPLDEIEWFSIDYFKDIKGKVTEIEENIDDFTSF